MVRAYVIMGVLICGLLAYANSVGWTVADSGSSGSTGTWVARGARGYHK